MSAKRLILASALACVALAASALRSTLRLDYLYYTTRDNRSYGFVVADGIIQLDAVDNGDARPRNGGAWDCGTVPLTDPQWQDRFAAACAPAGPSFLKPAKHVGRFIPFERGTTTLATSWLDRSVATTPPADPVVKFIMLSAWLPVWATGLPVVCWAVAGMVQRRHAPKTLCKHCGYDLRATPDRCPECGRVPSKRRTPLLLASVITSAVATPVHAAASQAPPIGHIVCTLEGSGGDFARYSPDGSMILTAGVKHARVWDARTFQPITTPLPQEQDLKYTVCPAAPAFSADGRKIFTVSDSLACVRDARTGDVIASFPTSNDAAPPAMNPDATLVATIGTGSPQNEEFSKDVYVWDVPTRRLLHKLHHPSMVDRVAFSPNGHDLLVPVVRGLWERAYHIWDARTGREIFPTIQPQFDTDLWTWSPYLPVSFSPDGTRLEVTNSTWFTLLDARTRKVLSKSRPIQIFADGWIDGVAFSADGRTVVTTCERYVQAWDAITAKPAGKPVYIHTFGWTFGVSPDGTRVACYVHHNSAGVWDLRTAEQVLDLSGFYADAFTFSPDGKRLAGAVRNGKTVIWDVPP